MTYFTQQQGNNKDSIDTFNTYNDITNFEIDKLYFVRDTQKYYRYDDNLVALVDVSASFEGTYYTKPEVDSKMQNFLNYYTIPEADARHNILQNQINNNNTSIITNNDTLNTQMLNTNAVLTATQNALATIFAKDETQDIAIASVQTNINDMATSYTAQLMYLETDVVKKPYVDSVDTSLQNQINTQNNRVTTLETTTATIQTDISDMATSYTAQLMYLETDVVKKPYVDSGDATLQSQINTILSSQTEYANLISALQASDLTDAQTVQAIQALDNTQNTRLSALETDQVKRAYVDMQNNNLQMQNNNLQTQINNKVDTINATNITATKTGTTYNISVPQSIATNATPTFQNIISSSDPTVPQHVTTKNYVDNQNLPITTSLNNKIDTVNATFLNANKTGTTLTLSLTQDLSSTATPSFTRVASQDPINPNHLTTKNYTDNALASKVDTINATNITATKTGTTYNISIPQSIATTATPTFANVITNDPTVSTQVATKNYTDVKDALKVNKAGDTMTGDLAMTNANISGVNALTATTTNTTNLSATTLQGNMTCNNFNLLNVANVQCTKFNNINNYSHNIRTNLQIIPRIIVLPFATTSGGKTLSWDSNGAGWNLQYDISVVNVTACMFPTGSTTTFNNIAVNSWWVSNVNTVYCTINPGASYNNSTGYWYVTFVPVVAGA